jgi:head-tail adaptor
MSLNPRLRRRLVLEESVRIADGSGGTSDQWQPLGALWAEVTASTGREEFAAAQVRPRTRFRIIVRGSPVGAPSRPRPDQRLREGARVFAIVTVAEADPAGRYLEITAEEGVLP